MFYNINCTICVCFHTSFIVRRNKLGKLKCGCNSSAKLGQGCKIGATGSFWMIIFGTLNSEWLIRIGRDWIRTGGMFKVVQCTSQKHQGQRGCTTHFLITDFNVANTNWPYILVMYFLIHPGLGGVLMYKWWENVHTLLRGGLGWFSNKEDLLRREGMEVFSNNIMNCMNIHGHRVRPTATGTGSYKFWN